MWWTMLTMAFAGTELETVTLPVGGAEAIAVSGIVAVIEIVGTDGNEVRLSGTVGAGEVELSLRRKDGVVVVGVNEDDAEDLVLRLEVPRTMTALTVYQGTGPVTARDLPAAIAVVRGTGSVTVEDVKSLRVQNLTGQVDAHGLTGDLLADRVTGSIRARDVGGDVRAYDVIGAVDTEAVAGETVQQGGTPATKSL